jgi:hypothetical protein
VTNPYYNPTGNPASNSEGLSALIRLEFNLISAAFDELPDPSLLAPQSGYLFGLTLANDVGTPNTLLDIAAGSCTDSTNALTMTVNALSKSIGAPWIAGNGNGGMGVGLTALLNTWYHVFAVIVSGVSDVFFDTSVTAANKPPGTTAFRRIGSFKTDASVHILPFFQTGDRFDWGKPVSEFSGIIGVTTAQTLALTGVPPNAAVQAMLRGTVSDASGAPSYLYVSSLSLFDGVPGPTNLTGGVSPAGSVGSWSLTIVPNASGQVRTRVSTTTIAIIIASYGWLDSRGRI